MNELMQIKTWHGTQIVCYSPAVYLWLEQDGTISTSGKSPHRGDIACTESLDDIGRDMVSVYESEGKIKTINEARKKRNNF